MTDSYTHCRSSRAGPRSLPACSPMTATAMSPTPTRNATTSRTRPQIPRGGRRGRLRAFPSRRWRPRSRCPLVDGGRPCQIKRPDRSSRAELDDIERVLLYWRGLSVYRFARGKKRVAGVLGRDDVRCISLGSVMCFPFSLSQVDGQTELYI